MKKLLFSVIFIAIITGIFSADYDNSGVYASYYGTLFLILLFATVGYYHINFQKKKE